MCTLIYRSSSTIPLNHYIGDTLFPWLAQTTPSHTPYHVMPITCTSPNELLGSMSGMFGLANGAGGAGGDNATRSMMMDMMRQQMPGGGMDGMDGMMGMGDNMTEAEMEHIMSMPICFPMTGEKPMDGMMGMMGQ